ncbi:MAG: recombinase [Shewanella sp.]|nr:recombinase [Shewanella sp.]
MIEEELTEQQLENLKEENDSLLKEFEEWLLATGLKQTTVNTHVSNVEFFVNDYLLAYDGVRPEDGIDEISYFMGSWFIRKALWASIGSLKSNAASFKKFYTFLYEKGLIGSEDLETLKQTIKLGMTDWLDELEDCDSLSDDFF